MKTKKKKKNKYSVAIQQFILCWGRRLKRNRDRTKLWGWLESGKGGRAGPPISEEVHTHNFPTPSNLGHRLLVFPQYWIATYCSRYRITSDPFQRWVATTDIPTLCICQWIFFSGVGNLNIYIFIHVLCILNNIVKNYFCFYGNWLPLMQHESSRGSVRIHIRTPPIQIQTDFSSPGIRVITRSCFESTQFRIVIYKQNQEKTRCSAMQ